MTCQSALFSLGDAQIAWIATHLRETWLNPIVILFTDFGSMGAVIFTIALAYWLWHQRYAKYLGYALFVGIFINLWLKGWIQECRPSKAFWLVEAHGFSFPSGHAQIASLLWIGFAVYVRSKWAAAICLLIGLLIALSRPYLGVHYPHDIEGGILLGLPILYLCMQFEKNHWRPLKFLPLWGQACVLLVFFAIFGSLINDPTHSAIACSGAAFGFWLGCQWEEKYLNYHCTQTLTTMLKQGLIGSLGILVIWKGIPDLSIAIEFLQYVLLGIWITYGAPFVFTQFLGTSTVHRL